MKVVPSGGQNEGTRTAIRRNFLKDETSLKHMRVSESATPTRDETTLRPSLYGKGFTGFDCGGEFPFPDRFHGCLIELGTERRTTLMSLSGLGADNQFDHTPPWCSFLALSVFRGGE